MGELTFIDDLRRRLAAHHSANARLPIPPGDDCALVPGAGPYLFAADMLMDQVHFDLRVVPPELAGRKALAVNLSDIAAMAGTPESVTVCLALPKAGGLEFGARVMQGLIDLAAEHDVAIAGGDTNAWNGPLVIAVAITGRPHPKGSLTRAGARVGDAILVTGALGGSLLSGRHLTFTPRLAEARLLRDQYDVTSMIDLSDGVATDLRHVLAASGVGARLGLAAVPVHADVGADRMRHALSDGEDFELCFTMSEVETTRLLARRPFGALQVTRIGTIVKGSDLTDESGQKVELRGYVHEMS